MHGETMKFVNISVMTWLFTITVTHLMQTGTLPISSHAYQHNPYNYRSNQGW